MEEKKLSIEEIDPNMRMEQKINEPNARFYDVREEPFSVYGLYNYKTEDHFKRMPDDVAETINPGIATMYRNTAGGRVRFSTDSLYVAIKALYTQADQTAHFPRSGSAGLDLYIDNPEDGTSRYFRSFIPDRYVHSHGECATVIRFPNREMRHLTIHMPLYSSVQSMWIGLENDAVVSGGLPYKSIPPVLYYGSSITQGGCCSRPGNAYENIISHRLGIDHINLGFSGSAKGEFPMANYMASLKMSAFVCDYDHNAPTAEHLRDTHLRLYRTFREKQPDTPYIMITRADIDFSNEHTLTERREVIRATYEYARAHGDEHVYFIDGRDIYPTHYIGHCTVDGIHPNDLGFLLMADAIQPVLAEALTKKGYDLT